MITFVFEKNEYDPVTRTITVHGPTGIRKSVLVESAVTGVSKRFEYDAEETAEEYDIAEGWDGEQDLSVYTNKETNTTLRVWDTPYDDWSMTVGNWPKYINRDS